MDRQSEPAQNLARQRHQESGEEARSSEAELHPVRTELPLKDHDLVARGQDPRVLVAVAHGQQPEYSERVGDGQAGETKPHECSSCRSTEQARELHG
ncbi:hypothetical protein [Streptomyces sp. NPDC086519]|uniref:hypothetical protein n=1 Tax=Streptomyces sp. NPDC086519 TaxID=3154863 RepID=UPI0034489821